MSNKKDILKAVIKALAATTAPRAGNMVVLGIVNSFSTIGHISNVALNEGLSEYIKQGYFEIVGEKIKITALGVETLF
ncbi:hypothetical protein [Sphingobacterium sp. MYb388]|uniref:hypothetical protein n=1 Tax=Sphingobacterium sp. MYb388 TaxID=2745437 RepID=UPI0030A436F1